MEQSEIDNSQNENPQDSAQLQEYENASQDIPPVLTTDNYYESERSFDETENAVDANSSHKEDEPIVKFKDSPQIQLGLFA